MQRELNEKETTLEIEYVEAITAPEPKQEFQHDDWVSCVDTSFAGYFPTLNQFSSNQILRNRKLRQHRSYLDKHW